MCHVTIRGRGAAHDPPNRFEPIHVERDAWTRADDPAQETRLYRDASRSIVATNDSPDVGFDASVNPYRGCEHGCSYCVHGDTPVLMGDGSQKPMSEIEKGDLIYGTTRKGWYRKYVRTAVLDHWEVSTLAYRVTLEDGTVLVVGKDHRLLTLRGWKYLTGSQQGANRRPHLTKNDSLLGIGSFEDGQRRDDEYRRGYVCGMVRGDGLLAWYSYHQRNRKDDQHQFRLALVDRTGLERTKRYLETFGVETRSCVFSEARPNRARVLAIRTHARSSVDRVRDLVAWPFSESSSWFRGYLAGIFDAEGSYSGGILRIGNTDEAIIKCIMRAMRSMAFDVVSERQTKNRTRPITYVRLRGGLKEHLRFFHAVDPAIKRKVDIQGIALKSEANLGVESIEKLRPMTLFDVTTGTGDYVSNGVVSHNCYARPGHEYFGLSAGLDFETKIFVKEDAPELLRETLASPRWKPKVVAMSGVTDPYQPVERRLGITRGCLEVLTEFRNPVGIVTKGHLVTRDTDLLGELARYDAAVVHLSITTLDQELQRSMEPRAVTPARRLDAIRTLADAGIPVGVMVAPVIPGLTDHELPGILERAAEAGATRAAFIVLRLPHGVKGLFDDWLERHVPDRREKVLNRLRDLRGGRLDDPRYGSRMRGSGPFAEQIRSMFEVAVRRAGFDRGPLRLSTAAFRRPGEVRQLELFGGR